LKTPTIRKRGIALAITMLVLSVMTLISVAFFQAYHSHFSITRSSRASETAAAGCEAAYDYVAYRLEHDRDWGTSEFINADRDKDPASPFIEIESLTGTHDFEGEIPDSGATITGTIYNNLRLPDTSAGNPDYPPLGTARCRIECKSGDSTRHVEFLVRLAPLFDSSAMTRADLNVDAETLTMRSRDTNRNLLRAEEDIYVPDMLGGTGQTKFYQADSDTADNNALMWAKGDIYSYDGAGGAEMVNENDEISKAQETSHGKLASQATSHFSVFDMDSGLIKVPDTHTAIPLNNPIANVPGLPQNANMAGRFTFTKRSSTVTFNANYDIPADNETQNVAFSADGIYVDVLEYYANPDDTVPTAVFRGQERTEDLIPHMPAEILEKTKRFEWKQDTGYLNGESIATDTVDVDGYNVEVQVLPDNKLVFGSEAGANFTFDLENQQVTATHDAQITVDGPFHVTSEENGVEVDPPKLLLGYEESGSVDGGVSKAVVRAKDTIDIKNGVTEGLGALISEEGDVRVQPKNTNSVTVDTSLEGSGLLVFAGRDVELTSPEETEDWNFKGLVYARGGIKMSGAVDDDGTVATPSATFEGSIVALSDPAAGSQFNGIEFSNCQDIEFIYSSKMLDAYVAQLPGERTKVETVYWRD
jgi:hypothetical protein